MDEGYCWCALPHCLWLQGRHFCCKIILKFHENSQVNEGTVENEKNQGSKRVEQVFDVRESTGVQPKGER